MAWLRGGDTAPTHPVALAVLGHPDCDDRLLNELFGFVMRCAMASTAHNIEYRIPRGTAVMMAGGLARAEALIDLAVWAGYFTPSEDGSEYALLQDDDFIHLIPWDQREWAKQQKRDRNNWSIVIPVRLRDGDGCRYCGRVVQWESNKAALAGTYDHLHPGRPASIDTYVVACRGCNAKLGDQPLADKADELLPPPLSPYYSTYTVDWMKNNRWVRDNDVKVPAPTRRRLSPGALAVQARTTTSAGSQPATKADGPRGHSTEHTPASASTAGPRDTAGSQPAQDPAADDNAPGPRDTAGSQPAQDPAGDHTVPGPRDTAGSQPAQDPAGTADDRTEGPTGSRPDRDPADVSSSGPRDTAGSQPAQDPAEQPPERGPKRAAPALLARLSPGETPNGAEMEQKWSRNCGPLPHSAPSVDHEVGQARDGSGRDGPGLGLDRAGTGRGVPGRSRAGTGRERASPSPDARLPSTRRRRR